jgi:hypothetical protein
LSVAWYVILERDISGFDHTLDGKAVAKIADLLDSVTKEKNLPTLMSFFSASRLTCLLSSLPTTECR